MNQSVAYVYVISYPSHPFFKIGRSRTPYSRIELFQTASPHPVTIDAMIWCPTENFAKKLERKLHVEFKEKRFRNEWFKLDWEDFNYIFFIQSSMNMEKDGIVNASEAIERMTQNGYVAEQSQLEEFFRDAFDCSEPPWLQYSEYPIGATDTQGLISRL